MKPLKNNPPHIFKIHPYIAAGVMVILAAFLRTGLLNQLGEEHLWFTFYLAVILAAFYGGFASGLLSTLLSCLLVFSGWFIFTNQPLIEDYTNKLGVFFFFFNGLIISVIIEALKRRQKKGDASIQLQSEIVTTMVEGVCLVRVSDATLVYTNPNFDKMFGYANGELSGKNISIINGPNEKTPKEKRDEIIKALNEDGFWSGEVHNIKKNGNLFWTNTNISTLNNSVYGPVWISAHQDITNRKRVEEALKKSEERLKMVITGTNDGWWDWDVAKSEVFYSARWMEILGYEAKEKILNISDAAKVIHPDDIDKNNRFFQDIINSTKISYETEVRFLRKDGQTIYTVSKGHIQRDNTGKAIRISGTTTDFTKQKKAERALKESETRFRSLIENLTVGVIQFDKTGKILLSNKVALELLGLTYKQLSGEDSLDPLWNVIHEDGTDFNEHSRPAAISLATEKPIRGIVMGISKPYTKDTTWLLTNAEPQFDLNGKINNSIVTFSEITESKKASALIEKHKKQLETILESLPIGVWILNENCEIISGNYASKKIWGGARFVGPDQFGVYKGWFRKTGKLIEPQEWAAARIFKTGEAILQEEIEIECFDKAHKIISCSAVPLKDSQQKIIGGIIINEDITSRKELENELNNQQIYNQRIITEKAIEEQEKQKKQISYQLHEDINQVLAAAKLYLDLLKLKNIDNDESLINSYTYLNKAIDKINALYHSIDTPAFEDFGFEGTLDFMIREIGIKNSIKIKFLNEAHLEKNSGNKLELLIYRVIQEQLNNIIKYSSAKNVIVNIKTVEKYLYLAISDDGVGFDADSKNWGFGLKNIQSRTAFYDGTMQINSAPGKGCKMEIKFPLKSWEAV